LVFMWRERSADPECLNCWCRLHCMVVATGEANSIAFDRDVAIIPPGDFAS
jgi:hypothetical protein